jgi:hypothetical protein
MGPDGDHSLRGVGGQEGKRQLISDSLKLIILRIGALRWLVEEARRRRADANREIGEPKDRIACVGGGGLL